MFNNIQDTTPPSTRIVVPVGVFTPSNPPPFRQISTIPAPMQAALPTIACTLANRLGEVATSSVIFCFLYNRVTLHSMRNPEWQKVLEATAYHTWYNINTGKFRNEEEALADACKSVLTVYASYLATQTPEMKGMLNISEQQQVIEFAKRWPIFAEQYQKLENEARTIQNSTSSFGGGFAPPQQSAWGSVNKEKPGEGMGGLASLAPSGTYIAPGEDVTNFMQTKKAADSYYDEPVQPTFRPTRREMFIPGVNDKDAKAVKPEPVKTPPKTSFLAHVTEIQSGRITHTNRNETPIVAVTADRWEASTFQPYHPAYRFNQEAFYEVQVDANGIQRVIAIINDKESEMDRSKHKFSSPASFYGAFKGVYPVDAEIKVAQVLTETAKAILSGEAGENDEATELYRRLGVIDNEPVEIPPQTSLKALITEARAYQISADSDELTFLVGSALTQTIVSKTEHLDIIQKLRTMSLQSGAKMLSGLMEDIQADPTPENFGMMQFLLGLDRAIKRELLSTIRFRMGIGPDFNFDSFMEDEEEIREALQNVHGVAHLTCYNKIQSHLLPTMLDSYAVKQTPIEREEDQPPVGFITNISPPVTLLLLNISDEQLGLQLPNGAVCEVFPDTFPGLYDFIVSVTKSNPGALHHYIVTVDDVVYEVNVGLVGDKHMVLTRVEQSV